MYKLVIVDDEYLVRKGLSETIDWNLFGITVAATAADGEEGLLVIEREKPDIVITDMCMPGMNGVGLIEQITARGYDCAVVVLSGYSDFEYVKATLENGIHAYLLKPVENEQIVKTVITELKKLEEERSNKQYYTQLEAELPTIHRKLIYDLLLGNFNDARTLTEKFRICKLNVPQNGCFIYATANGVEEGESEGIQQLYKFMLEYNFSDDLPVCSMQLYDKFISFFTEQTNIEKIFAQCSKMIAEFEKKSSAVVAVAISGPYQDLHEISACYHTAKQTVKNRLLRVVNCVLTPQDSGGGVHAIVRSAIDYICAHYAEDITIKSCAAALYVSDSHLMHLFKGNLGKTFNEYLTEYRVLQAKKLLRSGKMRVYEVAEAVGYSDVKYFGQVFRKYTGCMPSEYAGGED
ncbi:MAG: response regulator [Clostridia bacterium]|nr:response regulator [Clostridia bacterium]